MKPIGLKKALEMMRLPDRRLLKMHTRDSEEGFAFYIVPGGYIEPETAKKILAHPLVHPSEDGLFPGNSQTWRLGSVGPL